MSAILQRWSRNATFGSGDPHHFHNGLPFEADGTLCLQNGGVIDHIVNGIPFTANGRIAVEVNGAVNYNGSGSATFSVAKRLLVGSEGVAPPTNPELWTNPPDSLGGNWVDNLDDTYTVTLLGSLSNMTMTDILEIGSSYITTFTVSGSNGSTIHIRYNATNVLSVSADGDYEVTDITDGVNFTVRATASTEATVSNISVKKV